MYRPYSELKIPKGLTSVIGSGGKTTFLGHAAALLPGTVILTTSTHIYPFPGVPLVCPGPDAAGQLRQALARSRVICVGQPGPSGKLGDPSESVSFEAMCRLADYVLVEADGSARHPLKAHRPWEPVIPACSSLTVCLAGASGIGRPVRDACHCPELFAALAKTTLDSPVTPRHIAGVLNSEALADFYLINQTDTLPDPEPALELCRLLRRDACACSLAEPAGQAPASAL